MEPAKKRSLPLFQRFIDNAFCFTLKERLPEAVNFTPSVSQEEICIPQTHLSIHLSIYLSIHLFSLLLSPTQIREFAVARAYVFRRETRASARRRR